MATIAVTMSTSSNVNPFTRVVPDPRSRHVDIAAPQPACAAAVTWMRRPPLRGTGHPLHDDPWGPPATPLPPPVLHGGREALRHCLTTFLPIDARGVGAIALRDVVS